MEEICHAESCLQSARLTVNCHFVVALHSTPLKSFDCDSKAIVICSYRLLYSKVYRARLLELAGTAGLTSGCFERSPEAKKSTPDAAALRGPVDLLNLRRNTRRFREDPASLMWDHRQELPCEAPMSEIKDSSQLAFPVLEQIWWKRVVLDEFHELEAMGWVAERYLLNNEN